MARIISAKQRIIQITSPVNEDILTVSVPVTFTVYAPSETAVNIYKDSTLLGAATSVGGGYWEYDWTPPAIDYTGYYIKAYGVYSNYSESVFLFTAEANALNTTMTAWSKSLGTGGTVTGGITDPYGGTGAYNVSAAASAAVGFRNIASPAMSPAMTEFNHGLDIWVARKPAGVITTIAFQSFGTASLNLDTEESFSANGGGAYVKVVDRVTVTDPVVGAIEWVRVRVRRESKSSVSAVWTLNMLNGVNASGVTCDAGDGFYVYAPRSLDGIIPFTEFQKACIYHASTSGGIETWRMQHPYWSDVSIMNSSYRVVQVVKPTGWSATGEHECCIMLPARLDHLETTPPQELVAAAGDADTYNCVFIVPMDDTQTFGCKPDGTYNSHAVVGELLAEYRHRIFGCKKGRTARVIGYSKTAVTAYSLLMNYPDVFAKAAGWDGVWDCYRQWDEVSPPPGQIQGSLIFSLACVTKDQFALYDALTLLDSKISTINDAKRLVLGGYSQWGYYLAPFKAELDSRNIEYDYENTNRAAHMWYSGWLPSVLAYLMADVV